jgi:type VI secretion system protein VasD
MVELTVTAAPGLNPAPPGNRPSPVLVRAYGLVSANAFANVDFYKLHRDAAAALGQDLVAQNEFVVMPASRETVIIELAPGARYIGLVAGYRAIDQATWRAVTAVTPGRTTPLEASLEPLAVRLAPAGSGS